MRDFLKQKHPLKKLQTHMNIEYLAIKYLVNKAIVNKVRLKWN